MSEENYVLRPYTPEEILYFPIPCIITTQNRYRIPGKRTLKPMLMRWALSLESSNQPGLQPAPAPTPPPAPPEQETRRGQLREDQRGFTWNTEATPTIRQYFQPNSQLLSSTGQFLGITQAKFAQLLEQGWFSKIKAIQHREVFYRQCFIEISPSVTLPAPQTSMEGGLTQRLVSLDFLAGDECFGTADAKERFVNGVKQPERLNEMPLVIDIYREGLSPTRVIDKPNRVLISGTPFGSRSEYMKDNHLREIRTILRDGFTIPVGGATFRLRPMYLHNGQLYWARATAVEGISRTSGKGSRSSDPEADDLKIL